MNSVVDCQDLTVIWACSTIMTNMKRILSDCLLIVVALTAAIAAGAEPLVIDVWPGETPGDLGIPGSESSRIYNSPIVGPTKLITNVTKPTLTVYLPPKDKNTGT